MADAYNLENLTYQIDPTQKIKISDVIDLSSIQNFLAPAIKITVIILAVWIIFKIISWITSAIRDKRIKKTYKNTEEILFRLNTLEKKLDSLTKAKKPKEEKKK